MKTLTTGKFMLAEKAINIAYANAMLMVRGCSSLEDMLHLQDACKELVDLVEVRFFSYEDADQGRVPTVDIRDSDINAVHKTCEDFLKLGAPNGVTAPLYETWVLLTEDGSLGDWACSIIENLEMPAV